MGPQQQLLNREPPRIMRPGELVSLLWKFKHPHFTSCGVECNRWGAAQRKAMNLTPHGTIWFATLKEKDMIYPVPCNEIPYTTIKSKKFNEEKGVWEQTGALLRGWRGTFAHMTSEGYLYPHADLTYLIGQDSWSLSPKAMHQ